MSENACEKLSFASDYMEGAHPLILEALQKTNLLRTPGYGTDSFCASARHRIREACGCPAAEVFFLVGGTQTNAVCTGALLQSWQGVLAADTGHISTHEAGAIELTGHKVLCLPQRDGKLDAEDIRSFCKSFWADENCEHMVTPGMVYISHPSEYGTLYSLKELEDLKAVCREYDMPLYLDGARMAYALGCPENDVSLADLARLCDVFYIGGTKCGALFGEAVVIPDAARLPHFFTIMKQRGALLAKGRILGLQFDTLFRDGLYTDIGRTAVAAASRIRETLLQKGYALCFGSPTNQIFVRLEDRQLADLSKKISFSFWEKTDDGRTIVRLATSWATTEADVEKLIHLL